MFVGMALILFLTYSKLGGIYNAHEALTALADKVPEGMQKGGHQGWTSMPAAFSPLWWTLVSTIILGVGIGVLAQPQLAVRYMTVKSSKELHRAILIGGIFILMMTGTAFVVGSLSNVFFLTRAPELVAEGGAEAAATVADAAYEGTISVAAAGGVAKVIPTFLADYMPLWLADIFFITLMAAAMSTISSQFHAMGTAAGRDIVEPWMKETEGPRAERRSILATRLGVFITFLFSVTLAYVLPQVFKAAGEAIIARGTAIFMGLCAATFLPMYIGALYFRGITKAGAIWGSVAGFVVSAFWLVFVHAKEADALLIARFFLPGEKTSLLEGVKSGPFIWSVVDPLVVALPVTILVTILVSLFTKKFDRAHLDDCFARIHKRSARAVAEREGGGGTAS
jgi:SSS family solute:Na+ symporter